MQLPDHAGVAPGHLALHVDGAAQCVDHTAELDQQPVAGGFDQAATMLDDFWIKEFAAQRSKAFEGAALIGANQPRVAGHIGGEDGGEAADRRHVSPGGRFELNRVYRETRGDPRAAIGELFRPGRRASSLNHLVGAGEDSLWDGEAELLGGLEIDHQLEFRRLLDRQISGFRALQDLSRVSSSQAPGIVEVRN